MLRPCALVDKFKSGALLIANARLESVTGVRLRLIPRPNGVLLNSIMLACLLKLAVIKPYQVPVFIWDEVLAKKQQ
ncbi:hypothetical protein A9Q80_01415 [Cycloclasticus sp. 46_83_sub15_T18]|nr:hypothetical protein A9Q80_01415 [Cycloclasticus sp. 46_83_sub15_T18]